MRNPISRSLLLLVCVTLSHLLFAQTSWKGTSNTTWNNAANWTNGIPTSTMAAIIGDANFTGTNQPSIYATAACKSLTVGGTVTTTLTIGKNLTVNGDILINANATIDVGKATLSVNGNWTNNGNFTTSFNNATVAFGGTAQTIGGTSTTTFNKVTINAGSTTTLNKNIAANATNKGILTVNGILNPGESPTYSVTAGAFTLGATGTLQVKASTFAGNYNSTPTIIAGGTVDYAATTISQTVSNAFTYSTLKISGSGTKTLGGNLTMSTASSSVGNIYVTAGTLDMAAYTANRGTSATGGTLKVSNGATLRLSGASNFPNFYTTNTFALTSTVEYYGTAQTVAAQTYGNLNLTTTSGSVIKTMPGTDFTVQGNLTSSVGTGTAVSFTAASNITVNGNFTIGASTTFNGSSFSHTIAGNLINSGNLTGNASTITMSGAGMGISGTGTFNFYNLGITASNITAAATSAINVAGNFSTSGAGIFTHASGGSFTMSGTGKTISGASITLDNLTVSGTITTTSSLPLTGNLAVSGSFTQSSGTITMSGTSKTISGTGTIGFNSLSASGSITTASNFSIGSALDVSGSFTASAGTATFTSTSSLNGTANLYNVTLNGTSLKLATNAILGIAGAYTITAGVLDVTTSIPNTVIFNGSGNQTIPSATFHHLILANGGTKTAGGAIKLNGDFTINTSVNFNGATYTHTLYNNWINNGTFTAATSTIQFSGSVDAGITGATTFYNLTINKSSSGNIMTLANDVSAGIVAMTSGYIKTGSKTLTITTNRTGSGIIMGIIRHQHSFATGTDYAFESPYNKINFTSLTSITSITETVTSGVVTDYPYVSATNREYSIAMVASGSYAANFYLHYEDAELEGNNESTMQFWSNSGSWTAAGKTGNDATVNYVYLNGITNLSQRWTLASLNNVYQWNGSSTTDWNTAANWTVIQGSAGTIPGSGDVVQIGNSSFTNQPTISNSAAVKNIQFGSTKAATVTIASGGSLTTGGNIRGIWSANAIHTINAGAQNLTVGGDLVLSDGTTNHTINVKASTGNIIVSGSITQSGGANIIFLGSGNLMVAGDFNYSSGTFTAGSSTVTYNGLLSQVVAGAIYNNLTINKTFGIAAIGSASTINGNCTVTSGQLSVNANTTVTGSVSISSGATISSGTATLSVGGNWSNAGTFTPGSGIVTFNGTTAQSISATIFNTLIINKPSGTATLGGNLSIENNFTLSAGTLDLASYIANRTSLGGTFSAASGTNVLLAGANNFPSNFSSYTLASGSTVTYNGTTAQTVSGITYGNLSLTNGGANAKTLGAMATVNGDLTINSSATLNASAYTISLGGNWINSGSFVPSTGAVLLTGSSKTITGNTTFNRVTVYGSYSVAGADIVYNDLLNVTSTGSYAAGSGTATLNGDLTNSGTLTSTGTTTFTGTKVQTIRLLNALTSTSTGVVNFNGTVSPVLNSTSTPTFANLNINNTGGVNPSVGWTVLVSFTIGSGASFNGGVSTHTISGSFTNNGTITSTGTLEFNPSSAKTIAFGTGFNSSGTVNFGGSGALTITGNPASLTDVVIANTNASGVAPSANWNIGRNFTINSDAIFTAGSNTYTVAGDFESNGMLDGGSSTFNLTSIDPGQLSGSANTTFYNLIITGSLVANSDFNVAGNFTNNGTFDASIGSIIFTGSGNSVISGSATPYTLAQIVNAKDATANTTTAVNIDGITTLEARSGTFNMAALTLTQDAGGGNLLVDDNATLKIGGTNTLPAFTTYSLGALSTVDYAGTTQTISNATDYGNLTISATGTKTPAGALNIATNFSLSNGTFAAGNYTHNVGGNWIMTSGNYTNTGSTIQFNGTVDQTINSTGAFNNITINKATGLVILSANMAVNNTLAFISGKLSLSNYDFTMGSSASISGYTASNYIIANGSGSLVQQVANGSSKMFPVGNSTSYIPATIALTPGSTTDNFSVRVLDAPYSHGTYGTPITSSAVNATWLISEAVIGGSNATVTLQWPASLEMTGFNRAVTRLAHYTAGAWEYGNANLAASGSNPYTISRSGFTSFSPFAVSYNGVLPVTWVSISGHNEGANNHIYWSTAAESNNDYFSIEASMDGQHFTEVGIVNSVGASSSKEQYDFIHANITSLAMYYRIKQVDFDGRFSYSKIIKVVATAISNISLLSGNIVNNEVKIGMISGKNMAAVVQLLDASGKMVSRKEYPVTTGSNNLSFDVQNLAAGVYFLNIETADGVGQLIKFIKK